MKATKKNIILSMTKDVLMFVLLVYKQPWYYLSGICFLIIPMAPRCGPTHVEVSDFEILLFTILIYHWIHIGLFFGIEYLIKWYRNTKNKLEEW